MCSEQRAITFVKKKGIKAWHNLKTEMTFPTLLYNFKELRFFALDKIFDFWHEFNYFP